MHVFFLQYNFIYKEYFCNLLSYISSGKMRSGELTTLMKAWLSFLFSLKATLIFAWSDLNLFSHLAFWKDMPPIALKFWFCQYSSLPLLTFCQHSEDHYFLATIVCLSEVCYSLLATEQLQEGVARFCCLFPIDPQWWWCLAEAEWWDNKEVCS